MPKEKEDHKSIAQQSESTNSSTNSSTNLMNVTDRDLELDDFSYDLPAELIAREPCFQRSASRLMVLNRNSAEITHHVFSELPSFLVPGDCLVLNNTKVIPARIAAKRKSGTKVEILLLKAEPGQPTRWQAMASPLRKLKPGEELLVETQSGKNVILKVCGFAESEDRQRRLILDLGMDEPIHEILARIGDAPLPPYILKERQSRNLSISKQTDLDRYQTVYASAAGAVAAPTAGLHFSKELLAEIESKGIRLAYITLHVGPGTFKPISSSIAEHVIESEDFQISKESADMVNECRRNGSRIIAVGTTSLRALETAGKTGVLLPASNEKSSLYIRPGHQFKCADALITNFHLSKSSLLVLVSAFAGHDFIMSAYKTAVLERYRFYSYGDAMFIF